MGMSRSEAEAYLTRKGKIIAYEPVPMTAAEKEKAIANAMARMKKEKLTKYVKRKLTRKESAEIRKVMKKGKIYGDPLVELSD